MRLSVRLVIASAADHIAVMAILLHLSDDERAQLIAALRWTVEFDPLAPRVEALKGILERLEASKPARAPETASTG